MNIKRLKHVLILSSSALEDTMHKLLQSLNFCPLNISSDEVVVGFRKNLFGWLIWYVGFTSFFWGIIYCTEWAERAGRGMRWRRAFLPLITIILNLGKNSLSLLF